MVVLTQPDRKKSQHRFAWPSTTGRGTGSCRDCGTTVRFVRGNKREWRTLDGVIHREGSYYLEGEPPCTAGSPPAGLRAALRPGRYEPLSAEYNRAIAGLMWNARETASRLPGTRRLMLAQIKHLAFYWTTSALRPAGELVVPDAIKYDARHLRHTAAAHRILGSGEPEPRRHLRHEHAVPRSILAEYVLNAARCVDDVLEILGQYCVGVLVTVDEDSLLSRNGLRNRMPVGWAWGDSPFARYAASGLEVFAPTTGASPCSCAAMPKETD